jgi:hypothetical protein
MQTLSRKSILALLPIILMLVISSCSPIITKPPPTAIPIPTSTETPASIHTSTPANTASLPVTPSPRPTNTLTPQPGWVNEFAKPILDGIADRIPSFQDDFGAGSAGWVKDWCEGSLHYINGELVVAKCRVFRPNTDWRDFALDIDMRFLEGTNSSGEWQLHFRDVGNSGHNINVYGNGDVLISFANSAKTANAFDNVEFKKVALSNSQSNHFLLIAKGNRFAFYLNGQPLFYTENDLYRFGRSVFYVESGTVAMDNLKIWDIAAIPTP